MRLCDSLDRFVCWIDSEEHVKNIAAHVSKRQLRSALVSGRNLNRNKAVADEPGDFRFV